MYCPDFIKCMFSSLSHLTVNKILNLELIFFFCSEDIKNQNKIFPWNCENQEKFIGKGRGNSRILFINITFPLIALIEQCHSHLLYGGTCKCSLRLTLAGLSEVACYWQKWPPTWLVLTSYSAWHFFTDGVFWIKYPLTGCLLWQLSRLLQNFLTTLSH